MASVYVYNTTNDELNMYLNDAPVAAVAGTPTAPYVPHSVTVATATANNPKGEFGKENMLLVTFASSSGGYSYALDIPDLGVEDLQLYVFSTYIVLSRNGALAGTVGTQSNVPFAGTASLDAKRA